MDGRALVAPFDLADRRAELDRAPELLSHLPGDGLRAADDALLLRGAEQCIEAIAGMDQPTEMKHGDFLRACARHRADLGGQQFPYALILDAFAQVLREGQT